MEDKQRWKITTLVSLLVEVLKTQIILENKNVVDSLSLYMKNLLCKKRPSINKWAAHQPSTSPINQTLY